MSEVILHELPHGAVAVFSTRNGGVSEGPYRSLNLGVLTDDEPARVAANREVLLRSLGLAPGRVVLGHQVHGAEVASWTAAAAEGEPLRRVDGHVTTERDLPLLVLAADCLPVALAGHQRVAMLHCGWRGIAADILARGTEAVGANDAAAVIGPGIGQCCYEVGGEVLGAFADVPEAIDGRMLSLRAVAEARLRAAGVEDVRHVDLCTSCHEDLFFSHRRDNGVTGRQGGLVWKRA